jgi:hypothetical protein
MQYALVNFTTKSIAAVREAECSVLGISASGRIIRVSELEILL